MFSATGITAALAILALTVNVIDTQPAPPNQAGATHVVSAHGSGAFVSIQAAVDAAEPGDTISVMPGTYTEVIVIDKDITLAGDGPREEIVIEAPEKPPAASISDFGFGPRSETYAMRLVGSDAVVSGLTFGGVETSVIVEGGSPTLRDLMFDGAGKQFVPEFEHEGQYGMIIHAGSTATIADSTMIGGGDLAIADLSEPTIEGNVFADGPEIKGSVGDSAVIRGNTITDVGTAIYLSDPTAATIEGNTIRDATDSGIQVGSTTGHQPTVRDNRISGVRFGIQVSGGMPAGEAVAASGAPIVSGNVVSAELVGISIGESDSVVTDNTVRDSLNGIVTGAGSAEIVGNTVEVSGYGIDIGANSSPIVEGNTVCGGTISIKQHETADPTIGENTTCEAA